MIVAISMIYSHENYFVNVVEDECATGVHIDSINFVEKKLKPLEMGEKTLGKGAFYGSLQELRQNKLGK